MILSYIIHDCFCKQIKQELGFSNKIYSENNKWVFEKAFNFDYHFLFKKTWIVFIKK